MARNKQKDTLKKGLFPIRLGLPLALAVVFGLAALSVVTLIFFRHDSRPEPKPVATAAAANKLTQKIEAPKAAPVGSAPVKASPAGETPAEPASPAVETPKAAESSAPHEASESKPAAVEPSPETPLTAAPPMAAPPSTEPAKTSEHSAGSHAAPAPTPKPETPAAKPAAPGSIEVPKPVWQTVDQNWDKIAVSGSTDPAVGGDTAKWKELEIGQTEKSGQKTGETPKAEATAPAKPAASRETAPAKEAAPSKEVAAVKPAPVKDAPPAKETPKKVEPPAKSPVQEPVKAAKAAPEKKQSERSPAEPASRKSGVSGRDMDLVIVNESGEPGQAEVYRDVLKAMGYPVRTVTDGEQKTGQTTIIYRPGMEAKARSLAERIPGSSNIAPADENATFDIVILVR